MQRYSLISPLFLPHTNFFRSQSNLTPLLFHHLPAFLSWSWLIAVVCDRGPNCLPAAIYRAHLAALPVSSPSQPLLENGQGRVEGELGLVGSAVSQQQGACLGPVACRQQLSGSFLHVPASLLLVGQHVGAEQGVQG